MTPVAALRFGIAIALAVCAPATYSAEGIVGTWLVENEEARIEIAPCGDELCGTIVWMRFPETEDGVVKRDVHNPDESMRDRTIVGLTILTGVPRTPDEEGVFRGGSIYDPQRGRAYGCTVRQESGQVLRVRAFLGISLLGRTTRWTRVDPVAESERRPLQETGE